MVIMTRLISILSVTLLMVPLAFAHAVLVEANPMANGVVAGPDVSIELRFNSRIDAARSRLTLVRPDQTVRPVSLSQSANPGSLNGQLTGLGAGEYKLRWQVLASDGHITRGEIPFRVK